MSESPLHERPRSDALDADARQRAADEIAGVQIYLPQIAARLEIGVAGVVADRMVKNARMYLVP